MLDAWLFAYRVAVVVEIIAKDILGKTCPYCADRDPFFDEAHTLHVILTECGPGVTKCLAADGEDK